MDDREHIMQEIIKVLPEVITNLSRSAPGDAEAMHAAAGRDGTRAAMLPAGQLRALIHLAQHGPQTMGELAEGLQITMASATGLMKPLVEMGYATRTRDAEDRRVVRVGLSERAQPVADRIMADKLNELERAFEGMSVEACDNFLQALERLAGSRR